MRDEWEEKIHLQTNRLEKIGNRDYSDPEDAMQAFLDDLDTEDDLPDFPDLSTIFERREDEDKEEYGDEEDDYDVWHDEDRLIYHVYGLDS